MILKEHKKSLLIPDNAIRIRVIANSDTLFDQETKSKIKNEVSYYLYDKLKNIDNYNDADSIIKSNINNVKNIINNYVDKYEINYGVNNFPEKEYRGIKYDEGKYQSLVIKLGQGDGENFWCVLFPPLCLIDEENMSDATYTFYIKELLNKIK